MRTLHLDLSAVPKDDAWLTLPDPFGNRSTLDAGFWVKTQDEAHSYLCLRSGSEAVTIRERRWMAYRLEFEVWGSGNKRCVAVVASRGGQRWLLRRDTRWTPEPAPEWLKKESAPPAPISSSAVRQIVTVR